MNPSIPYWLCGVNFKINTFPQTPASTIYHTDSVESTSKCNGRSRCCTNGIPYWLCGVNFKIKQCKQWISKFLYHTDSVESTSKWCCHVVRLRGIYTILTLWSQLQNNGFSFAASTCSIPYWLCGVNFKMTRWCGRGSVRLYHTDSVESTSKYTPWMIVPANEYTILTLWSQLQNGSPPLLRHNHLYHTDSVESTSKWWQFVSLLTQRYTILTLWSQLQNWWRMSRRIYHTDSVESTSKYFVLRHRRRHRYTILTLWSQLQNNDASMYDVRCTIPYWLCGVNFKIRSASPHGWACLYHTDSVESTSK